MPSWTYFCRSASGHEFTTPGGPISAMRLTIIVELAVAGQADYLVTRNVRDLRGGELRFPYISVVTPTQLLKEQT
jgi:hypothetical protein